VKSFEIDAYFTIFTTISAHAVAMALCFKRCISETESVLNGLILFIGGNFISHRDATSTRRARPTAIAVHLVYVQMLTEAILYSTDR